MPDCTKPSVALVCPQACKIPSCTFEMQDGPLTCTDENAAVGAIWGALRAWYCDAGTLRPPSPPPAQPEPTHCTANHCDSSMFVPTDAGQCFCEPSCVLANDCCPDYEVQCRGKTTEATTTTSHVVCAGQCAERGRDFVGFEGTNGCACGIDCIQQGDCCQDFANECLDADARQLFVCGSTESGAVKAADCATAAAIYGCSSHLVKTLCPETCGNVDCTTTTSTTTTTTTTTRSVTTTTSTTTTTATVTTATETSSTATTSTATTTTVTITSTTATTVTATTTSATITTATATTTTTTTASYTTTTYTTPTYTTTTYTTTTYTTTTYTTTTGTVTSKTATSTTTTTTTTTVGIGMIKKEAVEISFLASSKIDASAASTIRVSFQIQAAVVVAAASADFPAIERGTAVVDPDFEQRLIFTIVFRAETTAADVELLANILTTAAPFVAESDVGMLTAYDAVRVELTEMGTTTVTATTTTTATSTITTATSSTATSTTATETSVTGTTITGTTTTTITATTTSATTTTNMVCETALNDRGVEEGNNCACYLGENCMASPFSSFYGCSNCCSFASGCFLVDKCRIAGATVANPNPTVCNRGANHEICGDHEVAVGTCGTGCKCVSPTTPTTTGVVETTTDNDKINDDLDQVDDFSGSGDDDDADDNDNVNNGDGNGGDDEAEPATPVPTAIQPTTSTTITSTTQTTQIPANCNWVNLIFVISSSSSIDDPDGPSQGAPGNFEALKCFAKKTVQDLKSEIDAGTIRVTVVRYADDVDVVVKANGDGGTNPWLPASTVINEINTMEYIGNREATGAAFYPTGADVPLALETARAAVDGEWGDVGTYMVILSDSTYWHASPGGEVALRDEVRLSTVASAHRIAVQIGAQSTSSDPTARSINEETAFLASTESDIFSAVGACSSSSSAGPRIASLRNAQNVPLGCHDFTTTSTATDTTITSTRTVTTTATATTATSTSTTTETATTLTGTTITSTTATSITSTRSTTTTGTATTVTGTTVTATSTTRTATTTTTTTTMTTTTTTTTATTTTATSTSATKTSTTATTVTATTTTTTTATETTSTDTTTTATTVTSTTATTATTTTTSATTVTTTRTRSTSSTTTTSATTSTDTAEIDGCLLSTYAGPRKGARGSASLRIGAAFATTSSKEGCAKRCLSTPQCAAIGWNWRQKRCELYSNVEGDSDLAYGSKFNYYAFSGRCKTTTTSTTTTATSSTATTSSSTATETTATRTTVTVTTATATTLTATVTTLTSLTTVTTTTASCPGGFPDPPECGNVTAAVCNFELYSHFGVVANVRCPALCGTCTTTTATATSTTIGLECILGNFLGPLVGERGLADNRLGWYTEIEGVDTFIGWTAVGIESTVACGTRCTNNPECTAFSYRANKRGQCELYTAGGYDAIRENAAEDYRHYFVDNSRCRDGVLLTTSMPTSSSTTTKTATATTTSATATTTSATTTTATSATATTTSATTTTATATSATTSTVTSTVTVTSITSTSTTHCVSKDVEGSCKAFMPGFPCICRQCSKGMYLHDGKCLQSPGECEALGLVPVGEASTGRACIRPGGVCATILGCSPPKALSFCLASSVPDPAPTTAGRGGGGGDGNGDGDGDGGAGCVECQQHTWLVNGKCKPKLYCRGSYYSEGEAFGKCTCRRQLETGSVDKNCGRCEVRKEPALAKYNLFPDQEWEHKGLHKACVECSNGFYFYKGKCVAAEACPAETATYSTGKRKSSCEIPFICTDRRRRWLDDADHASEDQQCRCADKSCSECAFPAGINPLNTCIVCKHHTYLLDGRCITAEQCIATGRMAHEHSQGPRGHVCI